MSDVLLAVKTAINSALPNVATYPSFAPQSATLPYICYRTSSVETYYDLGAGSYSEVTVEINVLSSTYLELQSMAETIRQSLSGEDLDPFYCELLSVADDMVLPFAGDEQPVYLTRLDYKIWNMQS